MKIQLDLSFSYELGEVFNKGKADSVKIVKRQIILDVDSNEYDFIYIIQLKNKKTMEVSEEFLDSYK